MGRGRVWCAAIAAMLMLMPAGCSPRSGSAYAAGPAAYGDAGDVEPDGRTAKGVGDSEDADDSAGADGSADGNTADLGSVTPGTEEYRGFTLDNVLHSPADGDIHFNLHLPDDIADGGPRALFVTLPGYQGLYFQGVGENLRTEDFGFAAQDYDPGMIVAAPQLGDWGGTSASQTIALVEYLLDAYDIDPSRVFAEGYSGGGETMSLVMGSRPDLFAAYLHCSSRWDGDPEAVAERHTPVYLVVGENDEYYGSEPSEDAYARLHALYGRQGLSDDEIDDLLVLDVKDSGYFTDRGVTNQHGGGGALFSHDTTIMGWLFDR